MSRIQTLLQMNNWDILLFIKVVVISLSIFWYITILDTIGYQIPLLRQTIGFFLITIVPGVLILRILRIHDISTSEVILYATGSSLALLMVLGLSINILLPTLGIIKPISTFPIMVTISIVMGILIIIGYLRDKGYSASFVIRHTSATNLKLSAQALFLLFPPILTILGTSLVNKYNANIVLLINIVLIALIVLLIGVSEFIPSKLYPFAIWTIAISLVWHTTLISQYLNVCDVIGEYLISEQIINTGFWDWTAFGNYNAVLSTVALIPIYKCILNVDLSGTFKVIVPLIYSLVALASYITFNNICKKPKIAFVSTFMLISISPFFREIAWITKQSLAELFLVLLIMIIFTNNINTVQKKVFFILFVLSLILSHYGTSYLFFISLLLVWIFIQILDRLCNSQNTIWSIVEGKVNSGDTRRLFFNPYILSLYLLISVAWYIYISGSSTFATIIDMMSFASNNLITEFFDLEASRGLYLATKNLGSPLHSISRVLYIMTQAFIFIGILYIAVYERGKKDIILIAFSISFAIILTSGLICQSLSAMDPRRLYHFSLFILAPFCIIGELTLLTLIYNKVKLYSNVSKVLSPLCIIYAFCIIFFLFNTGFVYEIAKDHPNSISISQKTIQDYGNEEDIAYLYMSLIEPHNVYSGLWITNNLESQDDKVYRGDWVEGYPSLTVYGKLKDDGLRTLFNMEGRNIKHFDQSTDRIERGYVQTTYANLVWGVGWNWDNLLKQRTTFQFNSINLSLRNMSKLYNNGGSEILWNQ